MKSRSLFLLAGAITLAAGTAFVTRVLMRPTPPVTIVREVRMPAAAAAPRVATLTAGRALGPGDFVDGSALSWADLPADAVHADQFAAKTSDERMRVERDLFGAAIRRPVAAGAPITRDLLVHAGEPGFLAAVLAPGMRAVSIPTNVVASNSGLVNAGDRVDVILSLDRDALTPPSALPNSTYGALAAQTVVRDVRVLAFNDSTASIAPAAALPEAPDGEDAARRRAPPSTRPVYRSFTLEVSPRQAEQLALAREVGTLQVALRGVRGEPPVAARAADAAPSGVTRIGDVTAIFENVARPPRSVTTYLGDKQKQQVFNDTP